MREYEDIKHIDNWEYINPINKGWSNDKKFHIKTKDNKDLLLKISGISEYDKKKCEFENIKSLEDKNILMSLGIDFGVCNNGKSVYSLLTWINGEDADIKIKTLTKKQQYKFGIIAGAYLKKIHSIPAPNYQIDWYEKFNEKIDRKISEYKSCEISVENSDKIISYIEANRNLLKNRPQCFQHGDYHIGNMIITPSNELGIIDFNRFDYGDPWEEFNRITWCAEVSAEFASGYINGYFDNNVPDLFFRLMLLYILNNQIGAISWAKYFGQKEIDIMIKQIKSVLEWYNGLESYIPNWYITSME